MSSTVSSSEGARESWMASVPRPFVTGSQKRPRLLSSRSWFTPSLSVVRVITEKRSSRVR